MSGEAAAVARRAAEIIQERGQCKGALRTADGRVCMWGAIRAAQHESKNFWHDTDAELRPAFAAAFPGTSEYFPGLEFNDNPDTDEKDIAKLLLQVADRLEVTS